VREDGRYIDWYGSCQAGHVADWIDDALRAAGWSWRIADDGPDAVMPGPDASACPITDGG
jgi:hypothetical protein